MKDTFCKIKSEPSTMVGNTPKPWIFLKREAKSLGFCAIGVTKAGQVPTEYVAKYRNWLLTGKHANMNYLANWHDQRVDTTDDGILKHASVVICVAMPYGNGAVNDGIWKYIAAHARSLDYHTVLKKHLHTLTDVIRTHFPQMTCRVFVDSAPVMERTWAVQAGLGSIGKNGSLIVPDIGPRVVLGEIICSNVPFPQTLSTESSVYDTCCTNCNKCIDACPTGAIQNDATVDSNLCLSYHSIENKSEILSEPISAAMTMIFGCDECTRVCPQNSRATTCNLTPPPSIETKISTFFEFIKSDRSTIKKLIKGTCLERTGVTILKRNALACLDNK